MEKKNFWYEVSKIIFSLGDPKNESTVELHEKEKSSIEELSKKLAEYAENNLINDQIGVISIPYTKNNDEKRKFVLIVLFDDDDDNRCKILAKFDYDLSEKDMCMLVDWLRHCIREEPDKVIEYLENYE